MINDYIIIFGRRTPTGGRTPIIRPGSIGPAVDSGGKSLVDKSKKNQQQPQYFFIITAPY